MLKKSKKKNLIIAGVVFAVLVVAAVYFSSLPLSVETFLVTASDAELYFIKEGYIKPAEDVDVYSDVTGKIVSLNVAEDDAINKGDIICVLDSSEYEYGILEARHNIESISAQKADLALSEQSNRDELNSTRIGLVGELEVLLAQQSDYLDSEQDRLRQENETYVSLEEQKQLNIRIKELEIEKNRADLAKAENDAETLRILYENNTVPENEYNAALLNVKSLRVAYDTSVQELVVLQSEIVEVPAQTYSAYYEAAIAAINSKIADIDNTIGNSYSGAMQQYYDSLIEVQNTNITLMNKKISDCRIASPVSGVIKQLNIKDASAVNQQAPIATITTKKLKSIEVYIPTANYKDVSVGQIVEISESQSSGDIVFEGTVEKIDDEAISNISPLGIEEREIKVTIKPDETAGASLISGFSFDVKFYIYREQNQVVVPKTAVFKHSAENGERDAVWLVKDGALSICEVELGQELRTDYVIQSGIAPSDYVIADAYADGLQEGVRVSTD